MKVSLKRLKKLFTACESDFDFCWKALEGLKMARSADPDLAKNLILFQERLATGLFELQKFRNDTTAEERRLISLKSKYIKEWFNKRMKLLSQYKTGTDQVLNMGKALGDAFAFFFYRGNLELLEKQLFHARISGFVAGTGGQGEMAFLRSHKHLDGKLTLYHGITNILRYGDFSFVDLHTHEIVEIGELKTKKIDNNTMELVLTAVGTKTTPRRSDIPISGKKIEPLDQRTADRLKRQVDAIIKIIKEKNQDTESIRNINGAFYFKQLQSLYEQSKNYKPSLLQVSDGLLYGGIKLPKANLFTRIFARKINKLQKHLSDGLIDATRKLVKPGSHNSIIIGQILYNPDYSDKNTPGTIPLFWYPVDSQLLKDLYFGKFLVLSVFNPIHLIDELNGKGYHVSSKYAPPAQATNQLGFKKGIEQFDLFISYIVNYLQCEESVLASIEQAESIILQKGVSAKALLRPQFIFDSLFHV